MAHNSEEYKKIVVDQDHETISVPQVQDIAFLAREIYKEVID